MGRGGGTEKIAGLWAELEKGGRDGWALPLVIWKSTEGERREE